MRKLFIVILLLGIFLSGCTTQKSDVELAKELCIKKCKEELKNYPNPENGPCISDEIIKDWVCDVAHFPRIEEDNFPQNQCNAYRAGVAHHFVEVDTECNFIRSY